MSFTASQPDTSYLLRKLHSFTGILPVGAFLAEHFWSNSSALVSPQRYNDVSQELQTIPFRLVVEWGAIFLPMLFHGGYGILIWLRGKSNVSDYPWVGNSLCTPRRLRLLVMRQRKRRRVGGAWGRRPVPPPALRQPPLGLPLPAVPPYRGSVPPVRLCILPNRGALP